VTAEQMEQEKRIRDSIRFRGLTELYQGDEVAPLLAIIDELRAELAAKEKMLSEQEAMREAYCETLRDQMQDKYEQLRAEF